MYKVKCTLVCFERDENEHPCHFNYKVGDTIYYDGERFEGRVCPGLIPSMMPIVHSTYLLGHKSTETIAYRYRGADTRDPEMEKYDGSGFRPIEPDGKVSKVNKINPKNGRARGQHFICGDQRTLAHFSCEPCDLSDSTYAQPFYRREIAILEKIEAEPGIKKADILGRFTDFELNGIAPRLTPVLFEVLMEALEDMGYIDIDDEGKVTATGKEPPSRPKIGD